MIVVLWRAGLRVSEALALAESDLDKTRGAVLARRGKGGKRREVGMGRWAWEQLDPWLAIRAGLPVGALPCVLRGPTRGRPCSPAAIRTLLRNAAVAAGVRRRFAPHQLRHAHAVEMSRERGPAGRHPAATRPCRPWDHLLLPARDRQHRNHPRRPRTTSTDDPGHHRSKPRSLSSAGVPARARHTSCTRPRTTPSQLRRQKQASQRFRSQRPARLLLDQSDSRAAWD